MLSFIYEAMSGELELKTIVLEFCAIIFVWAFCLPVHESAHAWAADRLGDSTGRLSGRISLNPLVHLSLTGTLMMLIFGFGYAKPVPVNIRNFKNRKVGFGLTAAAGPASNILMAIIFCIIANICKIVIIKNAYDTDSLFYAALQFFITVGYINISLAVFNLLPIPPLDGSRLAAIILPDRIYYQLMSYERYIMYGLFVLIFIFSRIGFSPVGFLSEGLFNFIYKIISLPFNFFI